MHEACQHRQAQYLSPRLSRRMSKLGQRVRRLISPPLDAGSSPTYHRSRVCPLNLSTPHAPTVASLPPPCTHCCFHGRVRPSSLSHPHNPPIPSLHLIFHVPSLPAALPPLPLHPSISTLEGSPQQKPSYWMSPLSSRFWHLLGAHLSKPVYANLSEVGVAFREGDFEGQGNIEAGSMCACTRA